MRIAPCPACTEETRSTCLVCDGCGEVVYLNEKETRHLSKRLRELIPAGSGMPTREQSEKFFKLAMGKL